MEIVLRPSWQAHSESWDDRAFDARDSWPTSTFRPGLQVVTIGPATPCIGASSPTGKINLFAESNQDIFLDDCGAATAPRALTFRTPLPSSSTEVIMRADVVMNTGTNLFYSGTNATLPGGYDADLWGALTHELGHALGMSGHFGVSDPLTDCDPFDVDTGHTMCGGATIGDGQTVNLRSTEDHDRTTQYNRYTSI